MYRCIGIVVNWRFRKHVHFYLFILFYLFFARSLLIALLPSICWWGVGVKESASEWPSNNMSPTQTFLCTSPPATSCQGSIASQWEPLLQWDTFLEGDVSRAWVFWKRKGIENDDLKTTKTQPVGFDVFTSVPKSLQVLFLAEILPRSQGFTEDTCINCFVTKNPRASLRLGWP